MTYHLQNCQVFGLEPDELVLFADQFLELDAQSPQFPRDATTCEVLLVGYVHRRFDDRQVPGRPFVDRLADLLNAEVPPDISRGSMTYHVQDCVGATAKRIELDTGFFRELCYSAPNADGPVVIAYVRVEYADGLCTLLNDAHTDHEHPPHVDGGRGIPMVTGAGGASGKVNVQPPLRLGFDGDEPGDVADSHGGAIADDGADPAPDAPRRIYAPRDPDVHTRGDRETQTLTRDDVGSADSVLGRSGASDTGDATVDIEQRRKGGADA